MPIESITSVKADAQTSSLVYPNPSNDYVQVNTSKDIVSMYVTNVLGQRVELPNSGKGNYSTLKVAPGYYNLIVMYKDNSIE